MRQISESIDKLKALPLKRDTHDTAPTKERLKTQKYLKTNRIPITSSSSQMAFQYEVAHPKYLVGPWRMRTRCICKIILGA